MSEYRKYLETSKLYNRAKKSRKRKRFVALAGISFLLLAFAVFYQQEEIRSLDDLKKIDIVDVISSNVSDCGDRKLPIYSVDTDKKEIALSFDAAWGAEDFDRIVDILEKEEVKATFFMTGGWIEKNPDCVKTLVEKGHELGNHGENHYDMTTISTDEMKSEIMCAHDKVKELCDYEMKVFRPPYGAYDNNVIDISYECNYYPIEWDVDSLDWKNYGVKSIIDTVCNHKNLGKGSIILCHNGAKYTADALEELIKNLKAKGYTFVTVSDLIMKENYHMDVNGRQIAD